MSALWSIAALTTGVLTFYIIHFGEAAKASMQISQTVGKILCQQQTAFIQTLTTPPAAKTKPRGGPCGWYVWSDCDGQQCKSFNYRSCKGNGSPTAENAGGGESNETVSTGPKTSGMDAPPNKYPSIVMIVNKDQQVCSGVVIEPDWVLSAARCFTSDVASNYMIMAGVHDQKKEEDGQQNTTGHEIFKHDKYDENSQANDIALIKLSHSLEMDTKKKATKLPAAGSDVKGEAFAVGWAQAVDPSVLQEVALTMMDSSSCKSGGLNEKEMCVSGPTPEACIGDPGGPMYSDGAVVGIASRGMACNTEGKHAIFTKVSAHVDWIKSTMESSPGAAPRVRGQRIVNGREVIPHKYPSIVMMKLKGSHACGGSIINENWVLTAAHCLGNSRNPKDYAWVAAEQNKQQHEGPEQEVKVVKLSPHSAYDPDTFENDIAMMKISPPFQLNAKVKPSTMPPRDYSPTGMLWVAGWGAISEGGSTAGILQEVDLPIVDPKKCKRLLDDPNMYTKKAICTGYDEGGKDACQGDSGGPLYHINGGQQVLVGVVSWGEGCARKNTPGVFTKVSYYVDWIQKTMNSGARSISGLGVVRGQVFRHKYPSLVAIKYQGFYSCVGTIIDKEWVVTAGSCMHSKRPADYQVFAGDSDIFTYEKTEQVVTAQQIFLHESFSAETLENDLMLLRVAPSFKFTEYVKAAYMPVRTFKPGNLSAKLVGWGLNTLEAISGPLLGQEIDMMTHDALACRKLKSDPQLRFSTLCAIPTNILNGCLGDLGSPLYYIDGIRHVLVGVRSAHSCNKSNEIEVFTGIPPYLKWISSFISASGKGGRGPAFFTFEGDTISLKAYPAAVMLMLHKKPKCSGVLLGPAWALTSAYCLSGSEISAMKVVAGREDSSRRDDPDEQVADIIETYEHPLYNCETGENDIGLVFFSPYFLLGEKVKPVKVPTAGQSLDSLTTIGWGVNTAKLSLIKEISLKVSKCWNEKSAKPGTLCVTPTREGSQCRGDPGSPVFTNSGRTLVGIQGGGDTCGWDGNAGVVTKIVQYRDWITRTMAVGLGVRDNSIRDQPPKYKHIMQRK